VTRAARQLFLGFTAALMAALLLAFLLDRETVSRPAEVDALGAWLSEHPADWVAANAIAEVALDTTLPQRFELWRAAYAHASRLAPRRPTPRSSFVRGGLFHWYELSKSDREAVLTVAAPLLEDPQVFAAMHRPLWELTGDFGYLRRNAPDTERALTWLRETAATHGMFREYREMRDEIDRVRLRTFEANRTRLPPPELIALLPPRLTSNDEPLVARVLEELRLRPLDAGNAATVRNRADDLVGFAIRHQLRPLEGLEALIETAAINAPTRARLALALGRGDAASNIELTSATQAEEWAAYYLERGAFETARGDGAMGELYRRRAASIESKVGWRGTCGRDEICKNATALIAANPIVVELQNAQSDEVPPYVEIYVGDRRVAEGPVHDRQAFTIPAPRPGPNRVEVRLVNPWTRNRIQRRVRLS
jgi:hypothetical protein